MTTLPLPLGAGPCLGEDRLPPFRRAPRPSLGVSRASRRGALRRRRSRPLCPLRPTVRRHLASGSALARHHRTLVRHPSVPDAPSHRLPVPPQRATHRHPTPTQPSTVASPLRSRPPLRASPSLPLPIASSDCCVRPCVAISRQARRLRAFTGRSSGTRAFPIRCAIVSPCRPIVRPIGIQHRRNRRQLCRPSGLDRCSARSHRRRYRSSRRPLAADRAPPSRVRLGARAPSPDARPAPARSRCAALSSPRAARSCDPSASDADATVARCVASPVPTAAPSVRIVAATDRVVSLLRPTMRRHLASSSALARHHRTLVRHACVPDALRHRLPVPPHRAPHRHPMPTHPSPVASPLRSRPLPHASASSPRTIASTTRVDRPRATTHALSSATRLGPYRLHSCHMSLSTAEPLILSHLTHR